MEDTDVLTEKKAKRKFPKFLKVILIILGVLVGLFLLIAAFISPIAKSYIEKHSPELIGRQVTMDDLSINLFKEQLENEKEDLALSPLSLRSATIWPPFGLSSTEVIITNYTESCNKSFQTSVE